jgi:hypothetical protein
LDDLGNRTQWHKTDPERLHELTVQRNEEPEIDGDGAYVRIVKMVRQIRNAHMGKARPRGLYFEFLTYHAFESGLTGASYAELLAAALRYIADELASGRVVVDPALEEAYQPTPETADLDKAAEIFEGLATQAEAALSLDRCPAAAAWRKVFGENENGPVFPLPPGCDEQGRQIRSVTAISSRGEDEARGYAQA